MAWNHWSRPLKSISFPWILLFNTFSFEHTPEIVEQKQKLRCSKNKGKNSYKRIDRLKWFQIVVCIRIIDTTHHSCNAKVMHREENTIISYKSKPEMDFGETFVHVSAKHLWKPIIDSCQHAEQASTRHNEMEMCNDKVGVMKLNIHCISSKKNTCQATSYKKRNNP